MSEAYGLADFSATPWNSPMLKAWDMQLEKAKGFVPAFLRQNGKGPTPVAAIYAAAAHKGIYSGAVGTAISYYQISGLLRYVGLNAVVKDKEESLEEGPKRSGVKRVVCCCLAGE